MELPSLQILPWTVLGQEYPWVPLNEHEPQPPLPPHNPAANNIVYLAKGDIRSAVVDTRVSWTPTEGAEARRILVWDAPRSLAALTDCGIKLAGLKLAWDEKSVAFPAIPCEGLHDICQAASVMLLNVRRFMSANVTSVHKVVLVCGNDQEFEAYAQLMHRYFPLAENEAAQANGASSAAPAAHLASGSGSAASGANAPLPWQGAAPGLGGSAPEEATVPPVPALGRARSAASAEATPRGQLQLGRAVSSAGGYAGQSAAAGDQLTRRATLTNPRADAITFRDPRRGGGILGLVAFYFPGQEERWDQMCQAPWLGNFFPMAADELVVHAPTWGVPGLFENAEAAFQALKFPLQTETFRHCSGDEAFQFKSVLPGADSTYSGFGSNWAGMFAVLSAKFQARTAWAEALLDTGDAFLLEHNSVPGRDAVWSDNCDGEGKNWLGLQLMLLRDELSGAGGRRTWTNFIQEQCGFDIHTGAASNEPAWQQVVRAAQQAVVRACATCARVGCSKPPWNGQPGEFCSTTCKRMPQPATCITPGCNRPTYDGRPGGKCRKGCTGPGQ